MLVPVEVMVKVPLYQLGVTPAIKPKIFAPDATPCGVAVVTVTTLDAQVIVLMTMPAVLLMLVNPVAPLI